MFDIRVGGWQNSYSIEMWRRILEYLSVGLSVRENVIRGSGIRVNVHSSKWIRANIREPYVPVHLG